MAFKIPHMTLVAFNLMTNILRTHSELKRGRVRGPQIRGPWRAQELEEARGTLVS